MRRSRSRHRRALAPLVASAALLLVASAAPTAAAQPKSKDKPVDLPPAGVIETPAGPESVVGDTKERLSDEDLEDKREGVYVTGLPIANYDPNTGFGVGATAFVFDNGKRSDKFFAYTPYRQRLYGVLFFTTKGLQFHTIDYDAPYIGGTKFRVRGALTYERNIAANYFGSGVETLNSLNFSGSTQAYATASDFEAAKELRTPAGTAYTKYNKYFLERPSLSVSIERDFFGGVVRPLFGITLARNNIRDFSGTRVTAVDAGGGAVDAVQALTKLGENCNAGRVFGCNGGWDTTFKLGVSYDTRDFEPDPNHGLFVDLNTEFGSRYTGSNFNYVRLTFSPKVYVSPFPKLADVVLAARAIYSMQTGSPFFAMNVLTFSQRNADGIGGLRTMRGFQQDRFVGNVAAVLNLEIRWTFAHFRVYKERFSLIASPFVDMGRVFDRVDQFSFKRWQRTQGGALRVAWNQATILGVDYGVNEEDSGIYVDFNYIF